MAVNLRKGQKTGTSKTKRENLQHLIVDLIWGEEQRSFFGAGAQSIDCDVSAIACRSGRDGGAGDLIYFGHFSHIPGDIRQKSKDLTGTSIGQGEQILVDLFSLPTEYEKIIFIFNIFKKRVYSQQFNTIRNPVIRVSDGATGQEICKFELSENHDYITSMLFSELYRCNGVWRCHVIGAHDFVHNVF